MIEDTPPWDVTDEDTKVPVKPPVKPSKTLRNPTRHGRLGWAWNPYDENATVRVKKGKPQKGRYK